MFNQLPAGTGIRIDAEGQWFSRGAEMTRRDIVQQLYDS
jgi:hypothetical protein